VAGSDTSLGASVALGSGIDKDGAVAVGKVEQGGIDYLDHADRRSTAGNLFFVFFGSQMCLGIVVLGALPIIFGLGFWSAVTAITVGTAIGSLIFAPAVMLGVKSGTCSPAGSVAHFGVRGRYIGSTLTLLVALGFFALTVWTGGDALVYGVAKLAGVEAGKNYSALGAAIICILTLCTAYFGHATIVASEKLITYLIGAVILIGFVTFLPNFNFGYAGGNYILGGFWSSWFLTVSVCAVLPISYAGFEGDYSRHIPVDTPRGKLVGATFLGMFLGCWVALVFAAFTTTLFADPTTLYVQGIIGISPAWFVMLLIVAGILGSQPQGSLCIYHAGLAAQVFGLRLSRPSSTVLLGLACLALVFVGIYLIDMVNLMVVFLTFMAVAVSPWLVINLVGHYVFSDDYHERDLFAYLTPGATGRYWYSGGFNWPAVLAWVVGVICGLMFTYTDLYQGPLANAFGGVTLDYAIAGLAGGLVYYVLEKAMGTTKHVH
jgi:purine-cytosine permease-like protein